MRYWFDERDNRHYLVDDESIQEVDLVPAVNGYTYPSSREEKDALTLVEGILSLREKVSRNRIGGVANAIDELLTGDAHGRKIHCIKAIRDLTGIGLYGSCRLYTLMVAKGLIRPKEEEEDTGE